MDNEEQVNDETLEVEEVEVETVDDEPEEDVDALRSRLAKAEELANNYKVRAEKAEGKTKEIKVPKSDSKLSTFDMLALQNAKIQTEEDLDEVVRWADYNKISVAKALESSILKATLTEKAELRKSAQAVNTGSTRRAGNAVSDERIIADARKGIMPESDEDIARLTRLRLQKK